jgi:hypothetical protein
MIVFRLLKHLDRMLKLESLKEELSSVKSKPPRREAAAEEVQQWSLISAWSSGVSEVQAHSSSGALDALEATRRMDSGY